MIDPQPSIWILGIRIDEPITTLTDLMVSAVCAYAFIRLHMLSLKTKESRFVKYYFLSMALATALGGLFGHAFLYAFSFAWKLPGWLTSMFSIALIERAVIEKAKPLISSKLGSFFTRLNLIELTLFVILTFTTLNFFYVEAHSAYGLLFVTAGFSLFTYWKTKNEGSKYFLFGVALCAISALFFMNEWSIHTWFNNLDISHTFMAIAAYLFYKGALKFEG